MAHFYENLSIFLLAFFQLLWVGDAQDLTVSRLTSRQTPSPANPLEDAFYKAPPGFEKLPLGAILRYRAAPRQVKLYRYFPIKLLGTWQILYRTQNSVGNPEATVVTVLVPYNAKPGNLFSFPYLTNAAYARCNPSFALQNLDPEDNSLPHFQTTLAISALNEGWYVSIADDGGPQAAEPAGLQMAYSTLDSIRAVLESGNFTGLNSDAITTLFGYSGGANAVGWATELQPTYAPELKIAGAAVGGAIPNLITKGFDHTWYTAFTPSTLLALAHDYANFSTWLSENLVELHEPEFRRAEKQCTVQNQEDFAYMNLSKFFKRGWESFEKDPVPTSVFKWGGTMGLRSTPQVPWFLYHNIGDKLSNISFTDDLYEKHCRNGARIYYERNLKPMDHGVAPLYRFPAAFNWLKDRHEGKPVPSGCRKASVLVDGVQWLVDGELLWVIQTTFQNIAAALGVPVGTKLLR